MAIMLIITMADGFFSGSFFSGSFFCGSFFGSTCHGLKVKVINNQLASYKMAMPGGANPLTP